MFCPFVETGHEMPCPYSDLLENEDDSFPCDNCIFCG